MHCNGVFWFLMILFTLSESSGGPVTPIIAVRQV
jgi:hypothetical protein